VPADLAALAAELAPQAGLDEAAALPWLAAFAAGTAAAGTSMPALPPQAETGTNGDSRSAAAAVPAQKPQRESRSRRTARTCQACGSPLTVKPGAGRLPNYCTNACRQRAHRQRRQSDPAA
jgi:hypothetical protein